MKTHMMIEKSTADGIRLKCGAHWRPKELPTNER